MQKLIVQVLLFLLVLSGCGGASEPEQTQIAVYRSGAVQLTRNEDRDKKLEKHITGMEGVEKASVVITGNTALVGISLAAEMSDRELMRLKARVEKEARSIDPDLGHVAVTAATEFVQRINNITDFADDIPSETDQPNINRMIEELTPPV